MANKRNLLSFRRPTLPGPWTAENPMRPGKTREDKRIGAWASKSDRNARQAAYREMGQAANIKRK